jgi:hypothetical protein
VELALLLEARASISLAQGLELGPVRANLLRQAAGLAVEMVTLGS